MTKLLNFNLYLKILRPIEEKIKFIKRKMLRICKLAAIK